MWDWAGAVLVFFGDESKSVSEMFWVFGSGSSGSSGPGSNAQMPRCLAAHHCPLSAAQRWIWWSTEG